MSDTEVWAKSLVDTHWPFQIVQTLCDLVGRAEVAEERLREAEALLHTWSACYGETDTPPSLDEDTRAFLSQGAQGP